MIICLLSFSIMFDSFLPTQWLPPASIQTASQYHWLLPTTLSLIPRIMGLHIPQSTGDRWNLPRRQSRGAWAACGPRLPCGLRLLCAIKRWAAVAKKQEWGTPSVGSCKFFMVAVCMWLSFNFVNLVNNRGKVRFDRSAIFVLKLSCCKRFFRLAVSLWLYYMLIL